jgi:hypothetical protein
LIGHPASTKLFALFYVVLVISPFFGIVFVQNFKFRQRHASDI